MSRFRPAKKGSIGYGVCTPFAARERFDDDSHSWFPILESSYRRRFAQLEQPFYVAPNQADREFIAHRKIKSLFDNFPATHSGCSHFKMIHCEYALIEINLEDNKQSIDAYPTVAPVDVKISEEATAFCEVHSLKGHLLKAVELAKKYFSSLAAITADVEQDPESDEKWITLIVTVSGTADSILASYNDYSSEWVSSVPSPDRYAIRISFNII
jgi:hypothetical protein